MSSVLGLSVYAKCKIGHDDLVGSMEETLESLLPNGASGGQFMLSGSHVVLEYLKVISIVSITRSLSIPSADGNLSQTQPIIEFSIKVGTQASYASRMEMDDNVTSATTAFEQMRMAPSTLERVQDVVSTSTTIVENTKSTAATWDSLIERIKLFTEIVDGISEV
jgi:hypothetical protein